MAGPAPARAGLFGDGGEAEYTQDSTAVINDLTEVLNLDMDAPGRDEKVNAVRREGVDWVAKYRRLPNFAGRPSYGATYSVINAVAGHYNNFGTTTPIPKKRLARIQKELGDAGRALERGR